MERGGLSFERKSRPKAASKSLVLFGHRGAREAKRCLCKALPHSANVIS